MSSEMREIISALASNVFNLLTSVKFPGTSYSIFGLLMASTGVIVVVATIRMFFGLMSIDPTPRVKGTQRGGNNKRIKVSEERKDDTH